MQKRTPLSRERVLRAAIDLADAGGIDGLSMRKLGQALGVEAMSLYNHVANKEDVLDGIVELLAGEVDLAADVADWKEAIRRRAISAHELFWQHPWVCNLWMTAGTLGVARMRFADAQLRNLREGGLPDHLVYHGFHVLQGHVLGFTLQEQNVRFEEGELEELAATFLREFPADEYRDLAEHVRQHAEPRDDGVRSFELGLDLILDGLERLRATAA